jgi:uracil-DNA glycosylase
MPRLPAVESLLREIRSCRLCEQTLPMGPRPVLQAHPSARILIAGQAPGRAVHESGIPFDDPSGERLCDWLGVTKVELRDERLFAIVPMGFCYPGRGASGDRPPRRECAETWRRRVLEALPNIELTVVIGRYAIAYHLPERSGVDDAVRHWRDGPADVIALPHPSPRNGPWLARHGWFSRELLPVVRGRVRALIEARSDTPTSMAGPRDRSRAAGRRQR